MSAPRVNAVSDTATGGPTRLETYGAGAYTDDVEFAACKCLWVSTAGNIAFVSVYDVDSDGAQDNTGRIAQNVPVGWFVCRAVKILSTGTTAAIDLVGY